jgi:FAD/FMN-containing dehydrogenase
MVEKERLVDIFGPAGVSDEETSLAEFTGDTSLANRIKPRWIVHPKNSNEIQKLVKLANETQTPLVPVSSGPPHSRGDTVPGTGGAVMVDLGSMKQIIRVDRPRRVAMIEPGVTFEELIPEIEKAGLRLNMPLLPRKTKSVTASILEREPVTMPAYQWDISDPLACLGIIFGNGEEFRTGQAAGPGTLDEQWEAGAVQKAPYGPGTASLHRLIQGAQGTIGIVTWTSLRCELKPKCEEAFLIKASDPGKLTEICHWLIRLRLANECFILNKAAISGIMKRKNGIDRLTADTNLPPWLLFYTVAGYDYFPEERVSYQCKNITEITQRAGVEAGKSAGGISANELLRLVQQTDDEPYWKLLHKGACEDIFFLTIYDKLESLIKAMNELANRYGYPATEIGTYIQPVVQGTSCHVEFNLFYDPGNRYEVETIKKLADTATRELMNRGAFFSRPYGKPAGDIINRDAASAAMLSRMKKIFDPYNIMNPGKLCF